MMNIPRLPISAATIVHGQEHQLACWHNFYGTSRKGVVSLKQLSQTDETTFSASQPLQAGLLLRD